MAETANPKFLRPVLAPDVDPGHAITFGSDRPLLLDAGRELSPFTVAYMTYGMLNEARSNAVLVCHALTLDQFAASPNPVTGKPGWWSTLIGPGKSIDTDRFFVVCANVVGGCMGTTGPAEIDPDDRQAFRAFVSASSPSRTWCGPKPCCSTRWASTRCFALSAARWAECRCCNGWRAIPNA